MAGAGYKLFNTGDVLLASEVNTYLQQQVTMVFANATARTSALSGVLAEGMMSYLQDTNTVEVYNGSSWVNVGNAGDITEVQAGTGISVASGTGPIPVVTNDMATTITAAGDIVVGTGSGTYDNLPIGTTGQVLTADTTVSPYKVKWAAAASGSTFAGCLLHNNDTAQTGIANNTRTALTFSAELYDTDGYHSTSTNTSRITIPSGKGGYYWIFAGGMSTNQASGIITVSIYKNGAQIISGQDLSGSTVNFGQSPTVNFVLSLVATDYIEARLYQNSGGTVQTGGQYYFGAYLIGS